MKRKSLLWGLLLTSVLCTTSCSDDKEEVIPSPEFELTTQTDADTPLFVVPGQSLELTYSATNVSSVSAGTLPEGWTVTIDESDRSIDITATEDAQTKATLTLTATGGGTETASATVGLYCLNAFDDPNGAFVLNEGNMTTENGSLIWISPEGYVFDDAYKTVNGSELGNVAQDMAFHDGKIYVISQNGNENPNGTKFENDGMLVVMDAKTLKKVASFSKEQLSTLDWPTHIAVLDEQHIYLRDKVGIYRLDISDKENPTLTKIEGSDGAPQTPFAVLNSKLYSYKDGLISLKLWEISPEEDRINSRSLPSYGLKYEISTTYGIRTSDDGKLWLLAFGLGNLSVTKIDPVKSNANITVNDLEQRRVGGTKLEDIGPSGVAFATRGDDVYYADGTTIYHLDFSVIQEDPDDQGGTVQVEKPAAEWFADIAGFGDDDAKQLYNGLAVHPVTGNLYVNTIKGVGPFYTTNHIWAVDPVSGEPVQKYENCTRFPAGTFFPAGR